MNKKYMIIGTVFILIIGIGLSVAYFTGKIIGNGSDIVINIADRLQIIFNDELEINNQNLTAGWEESKTFTVENKTNDTYYFNIIIENLLNELESKTLLYKITSDNGYNMKNFVPLPISLETKDTILASNIPIESQTTQTYKIELKYLKTDEIDQSDDMGKNFSGNLFITEGVKPTLCEFKANEGETIYEAMERTCKNTLTRTNFENILPSNGNEENYSLENDTESGVYKEEIGSGFIEDGTQNTVYYFAGNVQNNWVYFADTYWRIIRTNEDGGIRLLYAGTSPEAEDAYISSSKAFNENSNDPMYVGYKYGESGSLETNRLNTHNSTILGSDEGTEEGSLNWWYVNQILNQNDGTNSYDNYVSKTAIYCNDRAVAPGYAYTTLTGTSFDFAPHHRLNKNKRPSFKCGVNASGSVIEETQNVADKFSTNKSSGGNGQLTYPISLMTADEIVFAGGKWITQNSSAYYYRNAVGDSSTGTNSWFTMSPSYWVDRTGASVFVVADSVVLGGLANLDVFNWSSVRPVISIKSCATVKSGNGTSGSPYEFSIDESCKLAVN